MAGFIENLLGDSVSNTVSGIAKGFFGNDYLRDFQHASKTFRTDSYSYSPKFKFLFHVYFDINTDLIDVNNAAFPTDKQFGLAVKTIQLPSFSFETHTMNQYNRKRIVQTKIKYDDINISFHDDNANLIRQLWYNYYTYYYKDATKLGIDSSRQVIRGPEKFDYNKRNIYDPSSARMSDQIDWGYIGESSRDQQSSLAGSLGHSKVPFFKSIRIYGFNQHSVSAYKLINPMITSFKHDTYSYSESGGTMENNMTIGYETVKYEQGAIDGRNPNLDDFANPAHYDKTVSPIARAGANGTILGQGGLIDGADSIMNDLANGNILGAAQTAGRTLNTFKAGGLTNALKGDLLGGVNNAVRGTPNRNTNFNFPVVGDSK